MPEAIRTRPGLTTAQLAYVFSLSYGYIKQCIGLLKKGGHVTTEGAGTKHRPDRHYHQGSLPVAHTKPRAVRSRWQRRWY